MNIRRLMYKLQTALNMRGKRVKINQFQHWSEKQERMVTKYVASMEQTSPKDGRTHVVTISESYQAADIVQAFANLLADDGGGDG